MLKVNANSWHYRIWHAGREHDSRPKNLCRYFWHIALKVAIVAVLVGLSLFAVGMLLYIAVTQPLDFALGIGLSVLIIGGLVLLVWSISTYIDHRSERQERILTGEIELSEPGIVRSWLKAKKAKVCPMIEVTRD